MDFGSPTLPPRYWAKVAPDESGCWLWTASTAEGYGHIKVERKMVKAHRLAYTAANGPIPPGLDIDHLCRVRACVNPDHMEAVTRRTNVLRGEGATAKHARKTHCKRGHEFTFANTRVWRDGRICRTCRADEVRNRRQRQRAA